MCDFLNVVLICACVEIMQSRDSVLMNERKKVEYYAVHNLNVQEISVFVNSCQRYSSWFIT